MSYIAYLNHLDQEGLDGIADKIEVKMEQL